MQPPVGIEPDGLHPVGQVFADRLTPPGVQFGRLLENLVHDAASPASS
ncbi:hypothetical protein AABB02_40310 [Streptomyces rimosus]